MYHTTCEVWTQDKDQHVAEVSELKKTQESVKKECILHLLNVVINVYLDSHGQADSSDHPCHTITHVFTSIYIHSLWGNKIGDDGAKFLSAALENMVNLQVLQ